METGAPVVPAAAAIPATATPSAPPSAEPKAASPEAPKVPAKPAAPELHEVTVDGKVVKMTLEEMRKHAGLGKKAYANLEEAAKIRKDAESKLDRIKTPKEALKFLTDPKNGYNRDEVRAAFEDWYSETFIDPEKMTPEQRRIAELERENKEFKETKAQEKARLEAEENEREDKQTAEQLQQEITTIIEDSGLPKTKFTASRVAYWLRVNEAKGINAPKEMIIEQVKTERNNIVKSMADSLEGQQLVDALGPDIVKKIRQFDLAQIRQRRGGGEAPQDGQAPVKTDAPRGKISVAEVRRRARAFK